MIHVHIRNGDLRSNVAMLPDIAPFPNHIGDATNRQAQMCNEIGRS